MTQHCNNYNRPGSIHNQATERPIARSRSRPLYVDLVQDRDLNSDTEFNSTLFDGFSLTQMVEPHPPLCLKPLAVNHPVVPAAPHRLKSNSRSIYCHGTYSQEYKSPRDIDLDSVLSDSKWQMQNEQVTPRFTFSNHGCSQWPEQSRKNVDPGVLSQNLSQRFKFQPVRNQSTKSVERQSLNTLFSREESQNKYENSKEKIDVTQKEQSQCYFRNAKHTKSMSSAHIQPFTNSNGAQPQAQSQNLSNRGNPTVGGVELRSVEEIPRQFHNVFKFPYFNILQSLLFDEVLYTDKSVVASAPTGSGKTVIFELAVIRLLTKSEYDESRGKIIYMAPMKALCTERYLDWSNKFGSMGINCLELTGDSELDDFAELLNANLICTTPEKWDSMSRRWKDNKKLFQQIQLFLIDEIHILNDPNRGATVEAVVSRMKTLETAQEFADASHIRFVAVSATMPNYKDIAEWLGTPSKPASAFNLGEEYRPVKLDKVVLGYPFKEGTSDFRFDMNLSYRLKSIIVTHSHGKPTLVFCSSRKSVVQSAEALAGDLRNNSLLTHFSVEILHAAATTVHEHKLSELLRRGIGIHHAGLDMQDRRTVEELFKASQLPVLVSTSTLAMGVNLPAHLVVIKSTHFYNMGLVQEYSNMQVLQMIGRAGRPQFDTSATAVIMTKNQLRAKYSTLVHGTQMIESSLHKHLIEHLNAEIVLQTISDMSLVVEWIRHTFLYVRVLKNPCYYGLPSDLSTQEAEKKLQDLCLQNVNHLASEDLVSVNDKMCTIWPTDNGKLMARYCIAFDTMKQFGRIDKNQDNIAEMVKAIAHCAEFDDVQLRINEKRILNSLNRDKNKETIRFPLPGKIKTKQMKVNCLIQAQLSCLPVQDFSLSQDMAKIFRVGQRIAKCLMEFMYHGNSYSVLLHSILVYKAFKTKLWFDSRYVARQLDGIGPTMSLALANSGLSTFQKLEQAHPRDIEAIVNRHPPFGNQVKESMVKLPRYELAIEQMKCYKPHKSVLVLSVDLLNRSAFEKVPSSQITHQSIFIVGDADNNIVFRWRVFDATIFRDGMLTRTLEVNRASKGTKLNVSLLSQDTVGLDIQTEYEPVYQEGWFAACKKPLSTKDQTPASKLKAAMDKAKAGPLSSSSSCNHKCLDKSSCAHKCCKLNNTGKRPAVENKPQAKTKASKLEGPLYKESKDMKEVLSIFDRQQAGTRLTAQKFDQLKMYSGQSQSKNMCKSKKNVDAPVSDSHADITSNEFGKLECDDMSDVIILDDYDFEDDCDFEDLNSANVTMSKDLTKRRTQCENHLKSNWAAKEQNSLETQICWNESAEKERLLKSPPNKYVTLHDHGVVKAPQTGTDRIGLAGRQNGSGFVSNVCKDPKATCKDTGTDLWEKEKTKLGYSNQGHESPKLHTTGQGKENDEGYPGDKTLDGSVNGWADLDVFHRSRQCLFKEGRPIHLREDEWIDEDELPSLTNTPEARPFLPVVSLQQQKPSDKQLPRQPNSSDIGDCYWTKTTSSDEELCHFADALSSPLAQTESAMNKRDNFEMTGTSFGNAQILNHANEQVNSFSGQMTQSIVWSYDDSIECQPTYEYQRQTLEMCGLNQRSRANQQPKGLHTEDNVSRTSGWQLSGDLICDTQEHGPPNNIVTGSSAHVPVNDHISSMVISLTDSEFSSLLHSQASDGKETDLQTRDVTHDQGPSQGHSLSASTADKQNMTFKQGMNPHRLQPIGTNCNTYDARNGCFDMVRAPHTASTVTESNSHLKLKQGNITFGDIKHDNNKTPDPELQSSHRYGHVLAWNKTTSGQSGPQSSFDLRHNEEYTPKNLAMAFFSQGKGTPSEEAASSTFTNLFDGIFN